jgi:DNA-binding CsgD family transcriptional regulator
MFKKPSATKWHRRTAPVAKPGEPLSLMEIKILNWCSKGDTKARTAKRLGISESYVKFFFERIYIKPRVRTQGHAICNGLGKDISGETRPEDAPIVNSRKSAYACSMKPPERRARSQRTRSYAGCLILTLRVMQDLIGASAEEVAAERA